MNFYRIIPLCLVVLVIPTLSQANPNRSHSQGTQAVHRVDQNFKSNQGLLNDIQGVLDTLEDLKNKSNQGERVKVESTWTLDRENLEKAVDYRLIEKLDRLGLLENTQDDSLSYSQIQNLVENASINAMTQLNRSKDSSKFDDSKNSIRKYLSKPTEWKQNPQNILQALEALITIKSS